MECAHPRASVYERQPLGHDSQEIFCIGRIGSRFTCDIIYDNQVVMLHLIETNEKKKKAWFELSKNIYRSYNLPLLRLSLFHRQLSATGRQNFNF